MPLLNEIKANIGHISNEEGHRYLHRLASVAGGKPYAYIYRKIFPALRKSLFVVEYLRPYTSLLPAEDVTGLSIPFVAPTPANEVIFTSDLVMVTNFMLPAEKPFYMALKTNMLYDALAIPNLYAEFYLGKNWSVAGGGMYAWWSYDPNHRYWRLYGGDITVRRGLARLQTANPSRAITSA